MGKKMIFVIILAIIALMLCACGSTERWPRVCIELTSYRFDCINIPLRDGYQFADNAYDIAETEAGYDIVIHVERTRDSGIQREAIPWH